MQVKQTSVQKQLNKPWPNFIFVWIHCISQKKIINILIKYMDMLNENAQHNVFNLNNLLSFNNSHSYKK